SSNAGTINDKATGATIQDSIGATIALCNRPGLTSGPVAANVAPVATVVRALRNDDLSEADRIFRVAFGTFLGLPDPTRFAGDTDFVRIRWRIAPRGAFAAEHDGALAGTVFAACWGSVGFF